MEQSSDERRHNNRLAREERIIEKRQSQANKAEGNLIKFLREARIKSKQQLAKDMQQSLSGGVDPEGTAVVKGMTGYSLGGDGAGVGGYSRGNDETITGFDEPIWDRD